MARWRKPTEAERELWLRATEQVTPLRKPSRAGNEPAISPKPKPTAQAPRKTTPRPPPTNLPHLTRGETPSIDRRTADRLRRGRLAVQARLDLHGMNQVDAHHALNAFISRAQADGRRTVLVITGKGLFTQGKGVLRDRLGDWLNMPPLREKVLSFMPAQPRHGGGGAFYVLLRRLRETGFKGR